MRSTRSSNEPAGAAADSSPPGPPGSPGSPGSSISSGSPEDRSPWRGPRSGSRTHSASGALAQRVPISPTDRSMSRKSSSCARPRLLRPSPPASICRFSVVAPGVSIRGHPGPTRGQRPRPDRTSSAPRAGSPAPPRALAERRSRPRPESTTSRVGHSTGHMRKKPPMSAPHRVVKVCSLTRERAVASGQGRERNTVRSPLSRRAQPVRVAHGATRSLVQPCLPARREEQRDDRES